MCMQLLLFCCKLSVPEFLSTCFLCERASMKLKQTTYNRYSGKHNSIHFNRNFRRMHNVGSADITAVVCDCCLYMCFPVCASCQVRLQTIHTAHAPQMNHACAHTCAHAHTQSYSQTHHRSGVRLLPFHVLPFTVVRVAH